MTVTQKAKAGAKGTFWLGVGALVESWSESPVEARTPDGHSYR